MTHNPEDKMPGSSTASTITAVTVSDSDLNADDDDHDPFIEVIPPWSCKNISAIMTKSIENAFYRFGVFLAKHPWWTILFSLVVCATCASGMMFWRTITDDELLWTPYGSKFIEEKKWIEENFPKDSREESVILAGPNVISAQYIKYLSDLDEKIRACRTSDGLYSYEDLCLRNPAQPKKCLTENILRVWNDNATLIASLTDEDVVRDLSEAMKTDKRLPSLFSELEYDNVTGLAIKSKAMLGVWLLIENGTKVEGQAYNDPVAQDWELCFIEVVVGDEQPEGLPEGAVLEGVARRSFDDEIDGTVASNLFVLFIGCSLIFLYIAVVLGKFNWVEQRVLLSINGIVVIGLSMLASFGLCFFMNIFYADMHPIIPFLLLGIGVDDMFVIVQSLENLPKRCKSLPIPSRIGLAMKDAGVSITVTSLTDMMAFLIGATSSLPILRHFCLFCAMGVLFLYFFAITFFVGCLTLDEIRIDEQRPCICMKSKKGLWRPNKFSQKEFGRMVFDKYISKYLLKLPVKILVIIATLTMFGVGVFGVTQMEIDYSPVWYMRESSYQQKFYIDLRKYFPEHGERVSVFYGKIDYWRHLDSLRQSYEVMKNSSYMREGSIRFWFPEFYKQFCFKETNSLDADFFGDSIFYEDCSQELYFKRSLLLFLNSSREFFPDFKFNVDLDKVDRDTLWNGLYDITASRASFQHSYLPNTTIQNIAMDEIKEAMAEVTFEGEEFSTPIVYSFMYIQWEANKLMSQELLRNLSLTFGTVMVVTLLLVANFRVSILVLISVVFTICNVCGYAHFMGLTIEIVTSILLILSCGLALDYAAHIGVAYVVCRQGSRQERAHGALVSMGAAVFHGGFSTFTAFALLITSDSYIFTTFFKMFAMVVLFGLYHGLIFLPVLLSLIGPKAPKSSLELADNGQKPQSPAKKVEMNGLNNILNHQQHSLESTKSSEMFKPEEPL